MFVRWVEAARLQKCTKCPRMCFNRIDAAARPRKWRGALSVSIPIPAPASINDIAILRPVDVGSNNRVMPNNRSAGLRPFHTLKTEAIVVKGGGIFGTYFPVDNIDPHVVIDYG